MLLGLGGVAWLWWELLPTCASPSVSPDRCLPAQGRRAMEPIVTSAKTMLESSAGLIQTARSLAVNPKDPPQWSVLAGHSRTVSDSIKKLITNMR